MTMSLTALRALSSVDLINHFFDDPSDRSKSQQIIKERMLQAEVVRFSDYCSAIFNRVNETPQQRRILDVIKENFPYLNEEPVLDWMRETQPWELAARARDDGFDCSNMKDPNQALQWRDFAIVDQTKWRTLNPAAIRFWKAFYQKWKMWQHQRG